MSEQSQKVKDAASHVRDGASDWRYTISRIGLAAEGVFNLSLGLLVTQVAMGNGTSEDEASPEGAIEQVARQPFGQVLLVALVLGLVCLVVWRAVQAVKGDGVEGDGVAERAKFTGMAIAYGAITALAITILFANWGQDSPSGSNGNDQTEQEATAFALDWPAGRWIVGAVGAGIIVIGLIAIWRHAVNATFLERLDRGRMGPRAERAVEVVGRVGYGGRSIVNLVIGVLVITAAVNHDPGEAGGLSEALAELRDETWGQALLWLIAVGFVLYGLFRISESWYRRSD